MLIKKSSNNKKSLSWVEADLRMRLQQKIKFGVSQAQFLWGITSLKIRCKP